MNMDANKVNDKIKDFTDKIEGVAQILGSYIEHNLKDKEKLDKNLKMAIQFGESWVKSTITNNLKDYKKKAHASNAENMDIESDEFSEESMPVEKLTLKIKRLEGYKGDLPRYQSELASGFDVRAQLSETLEVKPGERVLVPTLLSFEIEEGYELQARPRSGWAIKKGMTLLNTPGTIDADYRGEVKIILINLSQENVVIEDQDRVAQLVLCPILQADFVESVDLSETDRGEGGFGSTGEA